VLKIHWKYVHKQKGPPQEFSKHVNMPLVLARLLLKRKVQQIKTLLLQLRAE